MDCLKYTFEDFKNQINKTWIEFSAKSAIVRLNSDGYRTVLNFGQLLEMSEAFTKLMSNYGIDRAERIAVISKYSAQAVVLNFMLAYSGYTAVLIDAALSANERNRLLEFSDVSAVFTTQDIYDSISEEQIKNLPVFNIKEDFSFLKFDSSNDKRIKELTEPVNKNVIAILFSSGTTGTMKGVQITYSSILYAHKCIVKYTNLDSNATFLDVLPQNHIAGYSSAISCSLSGTELGFISEVNAQALSRGFLDYLPTNFIMIPKIYEVIMKKVQEAISKKSAPIRWYANFAMFLSGIVRKTTGIKLRGLTKPIFKEALGKNMKICGCGTAPCSKELIEFYLNLGIDFVNVYGSTETGFPIAAANCNDKYPIFGCGNINQFPEIKIKISNPDTNGEGEIRVKTPLIMEGYFKDPDLTVNSFDEENYFKTGDTGYVDKKGNLYITGRIKESIILQSGKKVSPTDVDNYYLSIVGSYDIASRGIAVRDQQYDETHLFVSINNISEEKQTKILKDLQKASNAAPAIYKLSGIHFVDEIPKTTVGKVKRFSLEIPVENNINEELVKDKSDINSFSDFIYSEIRRLSKLDDDFEFQNDMRLKDDIGMDSLSIFELYAVVSDAYGPSLAGRIKETATIGSIIEHETQKNEQNVESDALLKYPKTRTEKDYRFVERFNSISKLIWDFKVCGTENIDPNEQYIICPNHESLFDGMWIVGFLEGEIRRNIYAFAAEHLFRNKLLYRGVVGMGGIPVDRTGNTIFAMDKAEKLLLARGNSLLIHPEGTRSRTGALGEFKQGAAQLAIKTKINVIPVCISGAYEIYPPNRKLPRFFNWKQFKRFTIRIEFGEPISPLEKSALELTKEIRERIIEMRNN